jgi:peptidyl-prolyl cis-trans isomerase A (cyclophilin A)
MADCRVPNGHGYRAYPEPNHTNNGTMRTESPAAREHCSARRIACLLCAPAVLVLASCAGAAPAPALPPAPTAAMFPLLDPSSAEVNRTAPATFKVLLETTEGDVVIEVHREWAPRGADRFYNLVRNGFYDDIHFFRTIAGFITQFGINGAQSISNIWDDATMDDDPVMVSNDRGTISFASAGPNTRTTQLFINLGNNGRLDSLGFAPFGRVTGGMDVVDRFFSGYGEGPPMGSGPEQERIQLEGNRYLSLEFPQLDRIIRARVIED